MQCLKTLLFSAGAFRTTTVSMDYATLLMVYHGAVCWNQNFTALSLESKGWRQHAAPLQQLSPLHGHGCHLSMFGSRIAFYHYENVTQQTIPTTLPWDIPCPDDAVPAEATSVDYYNRQRWTRLFLRLGGALWVYINSILWPPQPSRQPTCTRWKTAWQMLNM